MPKVSEIKKLANDVDSVFRFIDNHRAEAVERLFHSTSQDYKNEWMRRDVLAFWYHLDLGNRNFIVRIALENYSDD